MSTLRRHVPDAEPAHECPYCGERYPTEEILALHWGREHFDRLDDAEHQAYVAAWDAEEDALRTFRLKALIALVCIYFGFLFVYALA